MRELVGCKNTIGRTAAVLKKPHKANFNLFFLERRTLKTYIYSSINKYSCDVERCISDISDVTLPTVHSERTERSTRFGTTGQCQPQTFILRSEA